MTDLILSHRSPVDPRSPGKGMMDSWALGSKSHSQSQLVVADLGVSQPAHANSLTRAMSVSLTPSRSLLNDDFEEEKSPRNFTWSGNEKLTPEAFSKVRVCEVLPLGPAHPAPAFQSLDVPVIDPTAAANGTMSVRALRKTGFRTGEFSEGTPILYNDLQIPITIVRKL